MERASRVACKEWTHDMRFESVISVMCSILRRVRCRLQLDYRVMGYVICNNSGCMLWIMTGILFY